jgi:hypothetical protein
MEDAMRPFSLSIVAAAALAAGPALAGPMAGPPAGQPFSTRASNIEPGDMRSVIAPSLPMPAVGQNAAPDRYLGIAARALQSGRTGLAQQSLEMAETRLHDRSVPIGDGGMPDNGPAIRHIDHALRALGRGRIGEATHLTSLAAVSPPRMPAVASGTMPRQPAA